MASSAAKCLGTEHASPSPSLNRSSTTTTIITQSKLFTDLPNEIIARIFEDVVPADSTVSVRCVGTSFESKENTPHFHWTANWVPQLRLISNSMERIVAIAISKRAKLEVTRVAIFPWGRDDETTEQQASLEITKVCPAFLHSGLQTVVIYDLTATTHMVPIAPIRVADLPGLKSLEFAGLDVAEALGTAYTDLCQMEAAQAQQRAQDLLTPFCRRLVEISRPEVAQAASLEEGNKPAHRVLYMMLSLACQLDDCVSYQELISTLNELYLGIHRDNIEHLLLTTVLAIEAVDKESGCQTAKFQFCATGPVGSTLNEDAVLEHRKSTLLGDFDINGKHGVVRREVWLSREGATPWW